MSKLKGIFLHFSNRSRQKRAKLFRQKFDLNETTKILDLGSETGENINFVLTGTKVQPKNVYIADIDERLIKKGSEKFGFQPVLLDESGVLNFQDNFFDIVYCSSVIEHVTIAKEEIWSVSSGSEFEKKAWNSQKNFAEEIRRIGKGYFVQTPARNFPVESHTWLPFFFMLPRPQQIKVMSQANKFWIKQSYPDFNLLDAKQMKQLFPDADIVFERAFGLVKSIIAINDLR